MLVRNNNRDDFMFHGLFIFPVYAVRVEKSEEPVPIYSICNDGCRLS